MMRARSTLLAGSLALLAMACSSSVPTASDLMGRGGRNRGRNNGNFNNNNFDFFANQFGPNLDRSVLVQAFIANGGLAVQIGSEFADQAALCLGKVSVCVTGQAPIMGAQQEQNQFGLRVFTFFPVNINSGTELTVLEGQRGQLAGFRTFAFTFAQTGQVQVTPDDAGADPVGTVVGQAAGNGPAVPVTTGGAQPQTSTVTPTTGGSTPSAGGSVTYSQSIAPLMSASCLQCHGAGAQAPDLSSYAGVKAAAQSALSDMQAGKMPTSGPIDSAKIALFQQWVSAGEPQ